MTHSWKLYQLLSVLILQEFVFPGGCVKLPLIKHLLFPQVWRSRKRRDVCEETSILLLIQLSAPSSSPSSSLSPAPAPAPASAPVHATACSCACACSCTRACACACFISLQAFILFKKLFLTSLLINTRWSNILAQHIFKTLLLKAFKKIKKNCAYW